MSDEASPFTSTPTHRRLGQRIAQQISRVISPEKKRIHTSNPFAALIQTPSIDSVETIAAATDPDPAGYDKEEIVVSPLLSTMSKPAKMGVTSLLDTMNLSQKLSS